MNRIINIVAIAGLFAVGCGSESTPTQSTTGTANGKNPRPLSCQTFASISHCTIGSTILTLNPSDLTVTNFGAGGSDGVSSSLSLANTWSQTADADFPTSGGSILYTAKHSVGGGAWASRLSITQTPGATNTYALTPSLSGSGSPTFDVVIYDGGVVKARQSNCRIGSNTIVIWPVALMGIITGYEDPDFIHARWTLANAGSGTFSATLPNGTVASGTKVEFTETSTPGSWTTLTEVDVTGYLDSYTITAES
jgi:hypothetical protein